MRKNNFIKGILFVSLLGMGTVASAETFYYNNYHPKPKSHLTFNQVDKLEIQVMPTMLQHEELGDFYYYNKKYKDLHKSFNYYRVAGRQGSNYGLYMEAQMKINGYGTEKSLIQGLDILKNVHGMYEPFAKRLMAQVYFKTGQDKKALDYLKDVDTPEAYYQVGQYYLSKKDRSDALKWLQKSANQGHVKSAALLGKLYLVEGHAQTQKAIHYLKIAAKHGYEESQTMLGNLYFNGNSQMKADQQEGLRWYIIAGQNGDMDSLRKAYWILADQEKTHEYHIKEDPQMKELLYNLLNKEDRGK